MAIYTVANGGGNINAGATYVGGVAPGTTDTIAFTATSGQLTINTPFTIAGIDFTNWINTLTMSAVLTSSGNVTLVSGMTIAGASGLTISTTATLTSNGKTWPNDLTFSGTSQTYTLADNWTVNGTFSVGNSIVNGSIINLVGNLSVTASMTSRGTTVMNFAGTSTWTGNVYLRNSITVNGNLTLSSGGVALRDNVSFTYVSGTFNATTSVLTVNDNVTFNNVSTITFYRFDFGSTTQTTTLNSDLYVSFQVTIGNAFNTINGNNIYLSGSLSVLNTCQGTTNIIMNGTGAWSGAGLVRNNLTINTAGTITISGVVYFGSGTFTYTAGTVVTTGSTLYLHIASSTLNTNGIEWYNITLSANTFTLTSDLTYVGTLNVIAGSPIINGSTLYCKGSLIFSSGGGGNSVSGTTNIEFIGSASGTWMSNTTNNAWKNNVTINKSGGTLTIGSMLAYNTGTLTHIAGTVTAINSTLIVGASTTLNTNGITWNNITISNGTVTLNSLLTVSSNLTVGSSGAVTFSGTAGFNCGSFICVTAGRTITLKNGITYTVNNSLTLTGTVGSRITLQSSTTSSAFFNLNPAATQNVTNTNATWINSAAGQTILSSAGTLSNTVNWSIGSGNFLIMF